MFLVLDSCCRQKCFLVQQTKRNIVFSHDREVSGTSELSRSLSSSIESYQSQEQLLKESQGEEGEAGPGLDESGAGIEGLEAQNFTVKRWNQFNLVIIIKW